MKFLTVVAVLGCFCSSGLSQTVSPLLARGYTVIPQPQKVSLNAGDISFGDGWQLRLDSSVPSNDVAVEALREGLSQRFHITLDSHGSSSGVLSLHVAAGSVPIGDAQDIDRSALEEQAYRIDLHQGAVAITANAPTGLFYGVDTLIQLLRPKMGTLWLPEGTIEDWPDLQLRHIYWDDAHHLEKMDELKRAMKQAAFYKINGLVIKLEGHFQYKSAPAVVEPYALSPAQLQELTDYGLRYHIELIPYLDRTGSHRLHPQASGICQIARISRQQLRDLRHQSGFLQTAGGHVPGSAGCQSWRKAFLPFDRRTVLSRVGA